MSTRVLMDVGEYLHTSFDGPDCEYLDGEVIERNLGELPHGKAQGNIYFLLRLLADRLGILVVPEIRIRISETRYRVADLAVWREGNIGDRIPVVPPFLVVEVLSPEDRLTRVQHMIVEYLAIGVEWIWVVDPIERNAIIFSQSNPAGTLAHTMRTENPDIEIPLAKALDFKS
jgi:Uma2 family endonuclease